MELEGIWRESIFGIAIPRFAILWNCNSGTDLQFLRIAILDILKYVEYDMIDKYTVGYVTQPPKNSTSK